MWDPLSHFTLCIYYCHSIRVAPTMQEIGRSTKAFVFDKIGGGMNKKDVERFSWLEKDRQKVVVEQIEEEEGNEMEIESKNERMRKNVNFFGGSSSCLAKWISFNVG